MDLKSFTAEQQRSSAAFYEALRAEDDLGMIVRAQIHIESKLHDFIEAAAPAPQQVTFQGFDFDQTIRLALVLGLDTEFKSALSAVGNLRNRFAHRLDMSLGEAEAKNLYAALGPQAKHVAQSSYKSLIERYPDKPRQIAKLSPKDRIVLYLIALRGGLIVSIAAVKSLID
jgi:hypothetical protein